LRGCRELANSGADVPKLGIDCPCSRERIGGLM
jgi:hypothetical protein